VTEPTIGLAELNTISEVIARAKEVMDPAVYAWTFSGAGEGATALRNNAALDRLALMPAVLKDVSTIDTATSFLGVPLSMPVVMAPVGTSIMYHPESAVEVARGATAAGTASFCGNQTTSRWSEVAAVAPKRHFYQLYVFGDRGWLGQILEVVEAAGFAGICVTVDAPVAARRDFLIESGRDWRTERHEQINYAELGRLDAFKATFTWADLEWLCGQTSLPVILKGVMRPADAAQGLDVGVGAIYVSNHGGRSMDHGLSTVEILEEIVAAVGPGVDVAVDGGFTRGAEVCKALALGARVVGIGKLQCCALALGGAPVLTHVLEILQKEISITMAMLGWRHVGEVARDQVRWSFPIPSRDRR
jgi:isopentenyl diphosphate isomerase/L-lactate dehydrogenase-like FMN-dependent dehydrogenase